MLRGVWGKKSMKQSERRRPMMSGLVKYLATDSHMHAALLSPPSSRDLSTPRTVPFLDTGAKGGDGGGGNKRKRSFEKAIEYLKSDTHLYGALVDAKGSGSAATAGPMRRIERVVVAVSRGMLFIEESRINGVPQDTSAKKSRFPMANVAWTGQSNSVQGDKVQGFEGLPIRQCTREGRCYYTVQEGCRGLTSELCVSSKSGISCSYIVGLGLFVTCSDPNAGFIPQIAIVVSWDYFVLGLNKG